MSTTEPTPNENPTSEEAVVEDAAVAEAVVEEAVVEEAAVQAAAADDAAVAEAAPAGDTTVDEASAAEPAAVEEAAATAAADAAEAVPAATAEAAADEADADAEADAAVEAAPAEDAAAEAAAVEDAATEAAADAAVEAKPAMPTPGPRPTPAAMRPRPAAPAVPAPTSAPVDAWGRVDEAGVVFVREGDSWRSVGEYPDGTPDEALAYFTRKYDDLALKVQNLEQRKAGGGAAASDLNGQARALLGEVEGAAAVGDLLGLAKRLKALSASLSEASAEEAQAAREAVDAAIVERTALVDRAEALAARDPQTIQWKQASAELSGLFDEWQAHQANGPRLPRNVSQELWKRFRTARSTVERHRRDFFAKLDEAHKGARDAKAKLVERAEALVSRGEDGIPAYRALLDEWKNSGRAGRKVDDALWARFKAAGDALYGARSERDAAEQAESLPRIEARQALLVDAAAVADEADLRKARQLLTSIQRQWDEVGRIFPRDRERQLDDEMRKIEQALRAREDVDWKRNNPETKARATGMAAQLSEAIEKLEAEVAAAEAAGDAKAAREAAEALEARKAWLRAVNG